MNDAIMFVREFGSFGLLLVIVIQGVRYAPRAVAAAEGIRSSCERLEKKLDDTLKGFNV